MTTLDLRHEPATKEDGSVYRPYVHDDTGRFQGYTALVCRLCHAYYADPEAEPARDQRAMEEGRHVEVPWPAGLEGDRGGVCPARVYALLKETVL